MKGEMNSDDAQKLTSLHLFSCKAPGDPCLSIAAQATDASHPNPPTILDLFVYHPLVWQNRRDDIGPQVVASNYPQPSVYGRVLGTAREAAVLAVVNTEQ